mgnify:FL=1
MLPHDHPRELIEDPVVGLVEAGSENISMASHLPGVVERVFVVAGQDVKAGDPLVKLDTRALEAVRAERRAELASRRSAVVTARAQVARARAALSEVRRTLGFAEAVTDPRSISAEEITRRRSAVEVAEAEVGIADAQVAGSEAGVGAAEAALRSVETDLARSVVVSPINGRVLQLRIHPGEFAPAGPSAQPWLMLGSVNPLYLRVDVDEHEAWRVRPEAPATAEVRGNADLSTPLAFVRYEPYVVPKQSLTGSSTERVDTRVMQAIYRIEKADLPLFVGQQMDVFISARGASPSHARLRQEPSDPVAASVR